MTKIDSSLTDKQERFCREYLIDLNATQAAIRAGYTPSSAARQGYRLLANPEVRAFLNEQTEQRNLRLSIDADYVLRQAVKLHERCMQNIQPKLARGKETTDTDGNPVFEFDATNALKSLEMIGKHLHVGAFREQLTAPADLNARFTIAPLLTKLSKTDFAASEQEVQ